VSCARSSTSSKGTGTSALEARIDPDLIPVGPHRPTPAGPRSIGILGGTFNPPHIGHLALARYARDALDLELVLMIPARISPLKAPGQDPGPEHRLSMCRLAAEGVDGLSVSAVEIERGGTSYTVDTLMAIKSSRPDAQLTFITGADTARTLPAWREPQRLLELADLAVAARDGSWRRGVCDAVVPLLAPGRRGSHGSSPALRFLQMPSVDVSSSMVRERVARGEPIEDLVGSAVAGYIAVHGLYRAPGGGAS
jgi:nicotinate-nucleotide adenylyltransferase